MMFEDGSYYEGELCGGGVLNGKGTIQMASGDRIDATFSGIWNEGIRIKDGMLHKNMGSSKPVDFLNKNTQSQPA